MFENDFINKLNYNVEYQKVLRIGSYNSQKDLEMVIAKFMNNKKS